MDLYSSLWDLANQVLGLANSPYGYVISNVIATIGVLLVFFVPFFMVYKAIQIIMKGLE